MTPDATRAAAARRPPPALDLLALPGLGRVLRHRTWLQWPLLLLSGAIVLHGLLGPQMAPKNLATLLVWVHYRGLLVLALLAAGNLFCLACPFMLPRELARRLSPPTRAWPRALRGKGLSVALLVVVLFLYEWLDLWASPAATAWLVVGYFVAALVVDALFKGASFCKSVCPIGQFNFVASSLSPLEVTVRDTATCDTCTGHECITGARAPAAPEVITARGCELGLFLPEKHGNMDCTFCLDCARACPHDNVGLTTRLPGTELFEDRSGSGVGRLSRRGDLSLLAVVFTFGALLNAFAMVSPVYAFQQWIADALGTTSEAAVLAVLFGLLLVVEPVLLLGGAAALTRRVLASPERWLTVAARFAYGLVPLGFGIWLAHYGFHLLTGLWTVVPVTQRALSDAGLPLLGEPRWGLGGFSMQVVQPIEQGLLLLGLMGSFGVLWQIARREAPRRTAAAAWPWLALALALYASAVWLLNQPMEMRGTFLGA